MSAEWACFWMQDKPTTPLLIETHVEQLWEPMRAFQSVNLADVSSVAMFLRSISSKTGVEPAEGIRPLTNEQGTPGHLCGWPVSPRGHGPADHFAVLVML